jgi:hypothetical protein
MKRTQLWFAIVLFALACLFAPTSLFACEYKQGETKYEDWAKTAPAGTSAFTCSRRSGRKNSWP